MQPLCLLVGRAYLPTTDQAPLWIDTLTAEQALSSDFTVFELEQQTKCSCQAWLSTGTLRAAVSLKEQACQVHGPGQVHLAWASGQRSDLGLAQR